MLTSVSIASVPFPNEPLPYALPVDFSAAA